MTMNKQQLANMRILMRSLENIVDNPRQMSGFLNEAGEMISETAKKRAPSDTGSLRRAIDYRLHKSGIGLDVGVYDRKIKHARMQEYGGTIKPKNRQYLTIPLDPRYKGKSARTFDMVFVTLGGKKYMLDRATGKVAYRLKKTVTIDPKPYLRPAFEDFFDRQFKDLFTRFLDLGIGGTRWAENQT